MRKCARFDYIIESQEFLLFSRPQGLAIEKSLKNLLPLSTQGKYERIKGVTKIDPVNYDQGSIASLKIKITEFRVFYNKI